ncbi:MAG: hypothetical protein ACRBBM_05170 [Pseudomonadaceae bacterium]
MSQFARRFGPGSIVKGSGNSLYQVKELRPQFEQIVLEGQSGELLVFKIPEFNTSVAKGEYQPIYEGSAEKAGKAEKSARVLSHKERNQLDLRLEVLSEVTVLRKQGKSWIEILNALKENLNCEIPALRTIQRWYASSLQSDDANELAPKFSARGNRSQLGPEIKGVVIEAIKDMYCGSDRFNVTSITMMANAKSASLCADLGLPFTGVSRRTVSRILYKYATFERFRGRMSQGALKKALSPAIQYHEVEAPYDRVEFDATPLNVLVVDEDGQVIGKPTLYLIVDCATRCPIAFHLSIQAESQYTLLKLLEMAFHPRDETFLSRYGVKKPLAPCAMWQIMAGDNSAAHHGEAMYRALRFLGCTVEFTQAGKPQEHPFVERAHGSLKTGLIQMLAGSHISQEKLEKEALSRAMREAKYTVSALENLIARWICEVYMDRPLERLTTRFNELCSPRKAMDILSKRYPMLPPPTPDDFRAACMNFSVKHVSLTPHGIRYQCFDYNSEDLQKLLMTSPRGCKVEVRSHPLDVSQVSVVSLEDQKKMVVAYNKARNLPPMSFEEAKAIRTKFYQSDAAISVEEYAQGYAKLIQDIQEKNGEKKVSSKRHSARAKNRQTETAELHRKNHSERNLAPNSTDGTSTEMILAALTPAPRRIKE